MKPLLLLAAAWVAVLLVAPLLGGGALDPGAVLEGGVEATILWQIRLPRVLLGLLAGGALAMAGLAFQTLFRNPMAEPYTLGVASGAALGAVLALLLDLETGFAGLSAVGLAAFAGAAAVSAVILVLAVSRIGAEPGSLLLAGIAISLSCQAVILLIQYVADFTKTFRMVRWMMGGLAVLGYREVLWLAPVVVVGAVLLLLHRWELDLLLTGEEVAASRGVDVGRLRLVVLSVSAVMISALVTVAGPIGFVGLMVPHMLRRWVGPGHRILVPACLLGGGVFLALSDVAARSVLSPVELPVGVLTAALGGPFFFWLLWRERGRG